MASGVELRDELVRLTDRLGGGPIDDKAHQREVAALLDRIAGTMNLSVRAKGLEDILYAKPDQEPGRYYDGERGKRGERKKRDGHGLFLQVSSSGARSWYFRSRAGTMVNKHGELTQADFTLSLGSASTFDLTEAREKARKLQRDILAGVDVREERRKEKERVRLQKKRKGIRTTGPVTFEQCAAEYLAERLANKSSDYKWHFNNVMTRFVYPEIGTVPVADIVVEHIVEVLKPIWTKTNPTARKLQRKLASILRFAKARKHTKANDNPAAWEGLKDLLAEVDHTQENFAAMPIEDVPPFVAALRKRDHMSARALEFTILTTVRTNETVGSKEKKKPKVDFGARWDEIDLEKRTWTIPAARMKMERDHHVPLCDRAMEILQSLPREKGNPYVFIGGKRKGLGNHAMLRLLQRGLGGDGHAWCKPNKFTVHGFRSSFKDWSLANGYEDWMSEIQIAHQVGDETRRSYARMSHINMRRPMVESWAAFCAGDDAPSAKVAA